MSTAEPIAGQLSFDELINPVNALQTRPRPDRQTEPEGTTPILPQPSTDRAGSAPAPSRKPKAITVVDVESLAPLTVEVVRSARRRKTAQARLVGDVLHIRIPDRCSTAEEQQFVSHFRTKFERTRLTDSLDLNKRATDLAAKYNLSTPSSIRWVTNQAHRWGSCTPSDGSIRLSNRLAGFPEWVIDYVIVHELAHLSIADHSDAFWRLVDAYPRCERARGYLMAKSGEVD